MHCGINFMHHHAPWNLSFQLLLCLHVHTNNNLSSYFKLFAAAAQKLHPELSLPNVSSVSQSAEEKAMAACCGGNIQALQALIQAGVSVNHTSGNTNSNLLHMAAYCGQVRVSLLEYCILSNCPAFSGTVPIFSSIFTAVLLFLCSVPLFHRFGPAFGFRQVGRYDNYISPYPGGLEGFN